MLMWSSGGRLAEIDAAVAVDRGDPPTGRAIHLTFTADGLGTHSDAHPLEGSRYEDFVIRNIFRTGGKRLLPVGAHTIRVEASLGPGDNFPRNGAELRLTIDDRPGTK